MIRAVLDTNVFISGLAFRNTPPVAVLRMGGQLVYETIVSEQLLSEYLTAMSYPRVQHLLGREADDLEAALEAFRGAATLVEIAKVEPVVTADPGDDIVVATAVAGNAGFIVSGDRHLLALGEYDGIRVVTPAAFVAILEHEL